MDPDILFPLVSHAVMIMFFFTIKAPNLRFASAFCVPCVLFCSQLIPLISCFLQRFTLQICAIFSVADCEGVYIVS